MKQHKTIAVIGGGLAGLTLSTLLGQYGFDVVCVDAEPLQKQLAATFDGRTTAISYASRDVLKEAGVWTALEDKSQPITSIDILDGDSTSTLTFDAHEVDAEAFGWIVDNADLRHALVRRVQAIKNIRHVTGVKLQDIDFGTDAATVQLDNGEAIKVSLVVGADGRKSTTREIMGTGTWSRDYKQSAIVCLVAHEKPHHGLAVEHFRPEGPFALLPYTDTADGIHRSALVWTVHGDDAKGWATCDEDTFNAALQERSQNRYGKIRAAGKRAFWPLSLVKSYAYIQPRAVLVAEAAHGIHPIAGQGLNMSLRDLAALAELLRNEPGDIGDINVLKRYQRMRRFDNLGMALATDGLTMLFSNDRLPITLLRRAGLALVSKTGPLKRFFMHQAMGMRFSRRNRA